ncbi:MAG: carboxypeptidase-like regulatory domain-containing protein [Planctomycetaceae bacterium]|jgi:hypothetical protein|nr:carboxypeptidase-like regulatory domain-containing protein [Planctomycetaceae bacterium]
MKRLFCCLFILVCVFVFGCGGVKLVGLVSVRGTVTYNGQPLEGAIVGFSPKNFKSGDRVASGTTNSQGKFELRTIGELGALPNDYLVTVSKKIIDKENQPTPNNTNQPPPSQRQIKFKSLIPARYDNVKTSGLNFVVGKEGLTDVKIELSD